jgi:hypothetical protein
MLIAFEPPVMPPTAVAAVTGGPAWTPANGSVRAVRLDVQLRTSFEVPDHPELGSAAVPRHGAAVAPYVASRRPSQPKLCSG